MRGRGWGLALFGLLAAGTARADASCDGVAKAMLAIHDQPGVRQLVIDGEPGPNQTRLESIALPDAMYVRESTSAPWRKAPFDKARRRDLAAQALKQMPLDQCAGLRSETVDGVAVTIYRYRQPDLMSPGQFTVSEIAIAQSDGLPRRLKLQGGAVQTIEYGAFRAPVP